MNRIFNLKTLGAITLLVSSGALAFYGQPSLQQKWQYLAPKFEPRLLERQVQIDPAELLDLMNDDYIDLIIYDVRSEADWNLFHLVDSERLDLEDLPAQRNRLRSLPSNAVVVLISNDEMQATEGWKRMMALAKPNAYILEGGLNHWLNVYGVQEDGVPRRHQASLAQPDGTLRHRFKLALGDRHAAARPDEHKVPHRQYTPKVKLVKKITKSGGCG